MANVIKETVRGIDIVTIEDELLLKREIFLVDEVNAQSANELIKELMFLEADNNEEEITLYINSPGGEAISGLAVYDYLTLIKAPVRTVCIGSCASMAAILFLAGERRQMLPHTRIMIHDPSFSNANMSGRKPHEIQHELDKLNEIRENIVGIIAERTGKKPEEIYEVTAEDTYYNAEEAIKFGLATEILNSETLRSPVL